MEAFEIPYRYSHNALEPWKILDVQRKRAGRPEDLRRIALVPLYTHPHPINAKKLQDLQKYWISFHLLTMLFTMIFDLYLMPKVAVKRRTQRTLATEYHLL